MPIEFIGEIIKAVFFDSGTDITHQLLVVIQVVDGVQAGAEDLVALFQVLEVGAAVVAAGVTAAVFIKRAYVVLIPTVADLEHTATGVQKAGPGIAGGYHAIEHINTAAHRFYNVFRFTHPHQVTRLVFRQQWRDNIQRCMHFFFGFANCQPTNGVTRQIEVHQHDVRLELATPNELRKPLAFDGSDDRVVLPLTLPEVENYKPSGSGEGPLATIDEWINIEDPVSGQKARRESNTMPQWAGSCWYYLRFMDPHNTEQAWDPELEKYWGPVDLYLGGTEHAVLHLLYARFWHKVFYDEGLVDHHEPFRTLFNQGMLTAPAYQDEAGRRDLRRELDAFDTLEACRKSLIQRNANPQMVAERALLALRGTAAR